jgi:hypothetical protein
MCVSVGLITEMSLQSVATSADDKCVDASLQAFDAWMNTNGPLVVFTVAIVYGLGTLFALVHELGHASVGLARTQGVVYVQVGRTPGRWRLRIGRLDMELSPTIPLRARVGGTARASVRMDRRTRIAFIAAGPLASITLAAAITCVGIWTHSRLAIAVGAFSVLRAFWSVLPGRVDGLRTDGAALIDVLRRPRALDEWFTLFSDVEGTLGRERGRVVNAVPYLVEHPGAGPDALGVWRLAFAGWCWRAAAGEAWREMRDVALDALHSAARPGAVEPDVTIVAARALAEHESPDGFEHLPSELRSIPVEEPKQRFAFQFGVAFYDIDRARTLAG